MGLDMYLYLERTKYNWDENNVKSNISPKLAKLDIKSMSHTESFEIAYWRKANAIHKYFVDVVGDGTDECQPIYANVDDLKELYDLCEKVLNDNSKASELLPTQCGFFFGGTEYDEYYFNDIKETRDKLKDIISTLEDLSSDSEYDYRIVYQASW